MADAWTQEDFANWRRQQYAEQEAQEIRKYQAAHDAVQKAYDEVKTAPPVEYPSMWSVIANHPGMAGYQVMSGDEYQQAVKYDKLMRRLQDVQREHGGIAVRESPLYMQLTGGNPEPMRDRSFFGRKWGSQPHDEDEPLPPYRHRGVFATGQPLRNAYDAWMIPFSAVANTAVRPFYDLDKAVAEAPEVANKTFMGVPRAIRAVSDPNYKGEINPLWAKERKFAEMVPFDSPLMPFTHGDPASYYRYMIREARVMDRGTVDGPQLLEEMGYPDHWSRNLAGTALEIPLDPMSGMGMIAKNVGKMGLSTAAKRAAMGNVARGVGSEITPAAGWTALIEVLNRAAKPEPTLDSLVR